jgi:hypothetical protein
MASSVVERSAPITVDRIDLRARVEKDECCALTAVASGGVQCRLALRGPANVDARAFLEEPLNG